MKVVSNESISQIEVKGSKFIACLLPYDKFKTRLEQLKKDHAKARHFVYAYRFINEFDQIVENQSDDGEPKGSSGRPVLNVLRGNDLVNTAIIIVRYFGGTKLGVGGLVRAYTDSTNMAVKNANLTAFKKRVSRTIKVGFKEIGSIEHLLKQYIGTSWEKKFEEKYVEICFNVDSDVCDELLKKCDKYIFHGV